MTCFAGSRAVRTLWSASALTLALGSSLGAPLVLAGPARADPAPATASVNSSGSILTYSASSGQTNQVDLTQSSNGTNLVYLIDDVVPISAGNGCTYPDASDQTQVSCAVGEFESEDPYATLQMDLADGDDTLTVNNTTNQVYYFNDIYLGSGNDTLTDTGRLDGSNVYGQSGNDTLRVGALAIVQAGDGNDAVYAAGDLIRVFGGKGNDVLRGSAYGDSLYGGDGNDTLYGAAGSDSLYGGKGNDVLYGNSGKDELFGNGGNDRLYGGPGKDTLSGGPGRDVVHQD